MSAEHQAKDTPLWSLSGYKPPRLQDPLYTYYSRNWPGCNSLASRVIRDAFDKYKLDPNSKNARSLGSLAFTYFQWDEAASWFQTAIDKGDLDSIVELGAFFYKGLGISKNKDAGMYWISKANGIMSPILTQDSRLLALELGGKKRMRVVVQRRFDDPDDHDSYLFFGSKPETKLFIPIQVEDIDAECAWSGSEWVSSDVSEGYYSSYALTDVFFNEAQYDQIWSKR